MAESKNPKFDRAFAAARKKFKKTGDANDYTFYFKGEGREGRFTVNQKGETKKNLMAKFAPGSKNTGANYKVKGDANVRPKLRPRDNTVVSDKKPEVILKTILPPAKGDPAIAKLQKRIEGARSAAEVRKIVDESSTIKISATKMETLLDTLSTAGLFNFKPTKPKPAPSVKKPKPNEPAQRKVIPTKKRIISNAAVRKFMRKEFPGRLSNIEIGDTVFFRTNAAGDPVVASILKKVK
mgnify:CR=1 FL=1